MFNKMIGFIFLAFFAFQVNAQGLPPGNWSESCKSPVMAGATLKASCLMQGGIYTITQLQNANQCNSVENVGGTLVCAGGSNAVADAEAWLSPALAVQENINYKNYISCVQSGSGVGQRPFAFAYCMDRAGPANMQIYEQQRANQMDECLSTSYMQRFSKIHGVQDARQMCKMNIQSGMQMMP